MKNKTPFWGRRRGDGKEQEKNSARQEQASLASSDEAQSRRFGLSRKEGQRLVERLNALRRVEVEEASMRNPIWDRFWQGGPLEGRQP